MDKIIEESRAFSWEDNMAEQALEDFRSIDLPYSVRHSIGAALQKLKMIEEQGTLVTIPCKPGDTVYEVQYIRNRIQPYEITSVNIRTIWSMYFTWEIKNGHGIYGNLEGFFISDLGKFVFRTKEEAEAKLKELRGADDE